MCHRSRHQTTTLCIAVPCYYTYCSVAQSGELVTAMCKYWLQFGSTHGFVFLSDLLLEELHMLAPRGFFFLPLYILYLLKLFKKLSNKHVGGG